MAVIRVEKTSNYTVMSNHHLRNKDLSLKAKGLISLMLSLPPNWDYSVAGLAAICKEGMTSIRSTLKEMEENRYLVRKRVNSEKGYFVYEYTLYEIPETPCADFQHTDSAYTDNLHIDSEYAENHIQLSTEQLIKDKVIKEELKKEEIKKEPVSILENILEEEVEDEGLKELYRDYIDMRNTIRSPVSERALTMLIGRCARLANFDLNLQKEMIEAAVINNWKSVYLPEIKEQKKQAQNGRIFDREQRYGKDGYDALRNSSFHNK